MADVKSKKAWTAPRLIVHGTVEEITRGCDKELGTSDGYTFMGQAIICRS